LILTLANMGMGHYSRSWSLVGQAVRAAIDLNLDKPSDMGSQKARSRSKHVFLGCFAIDTIVSARMERRPQLRTSDIDLVGFIEEDGLEEWDPWTDCLNVRRNSSGSLRVPASILSTFNRLVQILRVLNDATCLPSHNPPQTTRNLLDKLHNLGLSQSPPLSMDALAMNDTQALSLLPHQYHLRTFFLTTLAKSQLLCQAGIEAVPLESSAESGRHIVELLRHHSDTFGLLIVPPTYEHCVKTAYDVVHAVNRSIENTHIILNDWKRNLDHCLEAMGPAWPVFESFKSSITYQTASHRRESQVAYDLISGVSQDTDTPMSGKTPQSTASYDTLGPFSRHIITPQGRTDAPQQLSVQNTEVSPQAAQQPSSGGHGLPLNPLNIYENAHAAYLPLKMSGSRPIIKATDQQTRTARPPSFNIAPPNNPQLHRSLTMSSADIEFDPMFNELMRLDATEWYVSFRFLLLFQLFSFM